MGTTKASAILAPLNEPLRRIRWGQGELFELRFLELDLASHPAVASDAEGDEVPAHEVVDVAVEVMDAEDLVAPTAARGKVPATVLTAPAGLSLDDPGNNRPFRGVPRIITTQSRKGLGRYPEEPTWIGHDRRNLTIPAALLR
jgi:hypothetical protein